MLSVEPGADHAVLCDGRRGGASESGLYYSESARFAPSLVAQDASLAAELWLRSERWTGQAFAKTGNESVGLSA